jgi:hypothetical protein
MMDRSLQPSLHGGPSRYLVWGGMTFAAFTSELRGAIFAGGLPLDLANRITHVGRTSADEEVVIFLGLLPHKIHLHADSARNAMLQSVNGKQVHSMRSVVQAIVKARRDKEEFLKLELGGPTELTLFTKECEDAHSDILSKHRVSSYASPDVMRMFEEEEAKAAVSAPSPAAAAAPASSSLALLPLLPAETKASVASSVDQPQKKAKRKPEKPGPQARASKRSKKKK